MFDGRRLDADAVLDALDQAETVGRAAEPHRLPLLAGAADLRMSVAQQDIGCPRE